MRQGSQSRSTRAPRRVRDRRRPTLAGAAVLGVAVVSAVLVAGEAYDWRESHRALGRAAGPGDREVVVVLGYRNRGPRPNVVNRQRVRAGLRSVDPDADTTLVMSGGAVACAVPEAQVMAAYARSLGYRGRLLVETESRSTWENIQNVVPVLEGADRIKIVSTAAHASRAREMLRAVRPDLADRMVRGREHRTGELTLLKPAMPVIALRAHLRNRRFSGTQQSR